MNMFGYPMGFGSIPMIVFWIVLIALVVWIVSAIVKPDRVNTEKQSALEILKQRYAQGEITDQQFDEMKRNLSSSP